MDKVARTRLLFIDDVHATGLDELVLRPGSFRAAFFQVAAHVNSRRIVEIGHPSSPPELYPNLAGPIFSRNVNAMWVPPDLVRPPYLNIKRFGPVHFGALGTLMGHELAHGISPEGRRYDRDGLLRETWSETARVAYDERMRCLEQRLESATKSATKNAESKIDAHQVLDEHVADLVGVQVALAAMESDSSGIEGEAQRLRRRHFFMAYAQQECAFHGGDFDWAVDDEHAPAWIRINTVLSNIPEFASTFRCAPGTPMAPVKQCPLW